MRFTRLDDRRLEKELRERRLRDIIMESRKEKDWASCRIAIMKDFLFGGEEDVSIVEDLLYPEDVLESLHGSSTTFIFPADDWLHSSSRNNNNGELKKGSNKSYPGQNFWNERENAAADGNNDPSRGSEVVRHVAN